MAGNTTWYTPQSSIHVNPTSPKSQAELHVSSGRYYITSDGFHINDIICMSRIPADVIITDCVISHEVNTAMPGAFQWSCGLWIQGQTVGSWGTNWEPVENAWMFNISQIIVDPQAAEVFRMPEPDNDNIKARMAEPLLFPTMVVLQANISPMTAPITGTNICVDTYYRAAYGDDYLT